MKQLSLIFTFLLIVACEAQAPVSQDQPLTPASASTSVSPTPMPTDPPSVLPIAPGSYKLHPTLMRLKVGETHRIESITEVSTVEQTFYQDYSRYHFSSENTDVATVDDNGVVTAVNPGQTVVYVASDADINAAHVVASLVVKVE